MTLLLVYLLGGVTGAVVVWYWASAETDAMRDSLHLLMEDSQERDRQFAALTDDLAAYEEALKDMAHAINDHLDHCPAEKLDHAK